MSANGTNEKFLYILQLKRGGEKVTSDKNQNKTT
jgi:hypothetical protein